MRFIAPFLVALVAVVGVRVAWGSDPPTLEERADAIERAAKGPDGDRVVVGHLSRSLKISVETLRAERARTGLGWGELFIVHRLATMTKRSFDDVVADYRGGRGWTEIARRGDADLPRLVADVKRAQEVVEERTEDQALRPDQRSLPPQPSSSPFPQLPIAIPGLGTRSDSGTGREGSIPAPQR